MSGLPVGAGDEFETPDGAWLRLRRHLAWAQEFWFGAVFTSDLRVARELAERAEFQRRNGALAFARITPETPQALLTLVDDVEAAAENCLVWVDGSRAGGADPEAGLSWSAAWSAALHGLNQRRDPLRRRLGGLVLVAPPAVQVLAMTTASDLWSVRDFVAHVGSVARGSGDAGLAPEPSSAGPGFVPGNMGRPPALSGERPAAFEAELVELRAMTDEDLRGPMRARLGRALQEARDASDSSAVVMLSDRLARALLPVDPAGARSAWYQALDAGPEPRSALRILEALFSVLITAASWDEAADLASRQVAIARAVRERVGTPESVRDLSVSLNNMGRVAEARGDWDLAGQVYGESLELYRGLRNQVNTPESVRDLSVSLDNVGRVAAARGEWDRAGHMYRESLQLRQGLLEQVGGMEAVRDVSVSLDNVGRFAVARENWDWAAEVYGVSLKLRRGLITQVRTLESVRDLSVSLDNVGRAAAVRGDLELAAEAYGEAAELARWLRDQWGTPESLSNLSASLNNVGWVAESQRDWDLAGRLYGESLELARQLRALVDTPESKRALLLILSNAGRVAEARGDWELAGQVFGESLGLARGLRERVGTPESVRDLSVCLRNVGRVAEARGDQATELATARELLPLLVELRQATDDPTEIDAQIDDVRAIVVRLEGPDEGTQS